MHSNYKFALQSLHILFWGTPDLEVLASFYSVLPLKVIWSFWVLLMDFSIANPEEHLFWDYFYSTNKVMACIKMLPISLDLEFFILPDVMFISSLVGSQSLAKARIALAW